MLKNLYDLALKHAINDYTSLIREFSVLSVRVDHTNSVTEIVQFVILRLALKSSICYV